MKYVLQDRVTVTGSVTYCTPHVDIGEPAQLLLGILAHPVECAEVEATIQTSDDLKIWVATELAVSVSAAGFGIAATDRRAALHGRYVRAAISVSGASPLATYRVTLNTTPSS